MTDCDNHAATVTAPLYVAHGDRFWTQPDVTRCVSCDETVTLPEPEEPARD